MLDKTPARRCYRRMRERQRRKHNPSPPAGAAVDGSNQAEGGPWQKGSHAIPPARVDAVPTPEPCATVRAISQPRPFIRHVQAAGPQAVHSNGKRWREGDEADLSTADDLDVAVKKKPAPKRR